MAHRIPTSDVTPNGQTSFVYVVDTPVGARADNKRKADVQLVQLFLHTFYKSNPALFKKLPRTRRNTGEILMDGISGPQTVSGITEFQKFIIRKGKSGVIVDGRVSIPHGGLRVANTNHVFTIFQLNSFFFILDDANAAFIENLEEHPIVKSQLPELASELRRSKNA